MTLWPTLDASCIFMAAATVALMGCNAVTTRVSTSQSAPTVGYHAYGDSITYGYLLHDPQKQAYPVLVATDEHVTGFANYAISGQGACDISKWQVAAQKDSPTLETHPFYSVLIGTNDVHHNNAALYESTYTLCYRGVLSWLAVPREFKVLAGDAGMATSGPGDFESIDGWKVWSTSVNGGSVSFTITTTRQGPIYAWPMIDDGREATYDYALDGVVAGEASMDTDPPVLTKVGTRGALGFIRIPDVPAGQHIVTFTQTSNDESGVAVVGIGAPDGLATGQLPSVLAGTIPYQYFGGKNGTCTQGDPLCQGYIQAISDSVDLFHGDGLNVKLFDTRKYMHGTAKEMADSYHPNALGQEEIGESVEAAW